MNKETLAIMLVALGLTALGLDMVYSIFGGEIEPSDARELTDQEEEQAKVAAIELASNRLPFRNRHAMIGDDHSITGFEGLWAYSTYSLYSCGHYGPMSLSTKASSPTVAARLVRPDGTPAAGARAQLWNGLRGDQYASDICEADGEGVVHVPARRPGDYFLLAHEVGYGAVRTDRFFIKTVAGTDLGTLCLSAVGQLRGRVIDAEGRPLPGVYVQVGRVRTDSKSAESAKENHSFYSLYLDAKPLVIRDGLTVGLDVSDDEGRFEVRGLRGGDHFVFAQPSAKPYKGGRIEFWAIAALEDDVTLVVSDAAKVRRD